MKPSTPPGSEPQAREPRSIDSRRQRSRLPQWFADPYRKLAALALAIGLWFLLDNQVTRDLERTLRLEVKGPQNLVLGTAVSRLAVALPTDQVVGLRFLDGTREIEEVKIRLRGPRYRIEALADSTLDLLVSRYLTLDDWSGRRRLDITSSDIQRNSLSLQDVQIEMEPRYLALEIEKIDDRALPLSLDLVELIYDDQLEPRLRRETASFSPDVARLLGPASSLAQFPAKDSKPLRARLRARTSDRQISSTLELLADPGLGLRLSETPSLTIELRPVTQVFELELQVQVDDLALPVEQQGIYRPQANTMRVRIRAGGQLRSTLVSLGEDASKARLTAWAHAFLRLAVFIPPPEGGQVYSNTIVREARLLLRGPLHQIVDRSECELDQTVSVTLVRRP
jgi:hypothetical protein